MSSILHETTLPLTEAPAWLPKKHGKPMAFSTVFRWAFKGIVANGERVRLETIKLGGRLITSKEAVARFAARLSGDTDAQPEPDPIRTPTARSKAAASAKRKLSEIGI